MQSRHLLRSLVFQRSHSCREPAGFFLRHWRIAMADRLIESLRFHILSLYHPFYLTLYPLEPNIETAAADRLACRACRVIAEADCKLVVNAVELNWRPDPV